MGQYEVSEARVGAAGSWTGKKSSREIQESQQMSNFLRLRVAWCQPFSLPFPPDTGMLPQMLCTSTHAWAPLIFLFFRVCILDWSVTDRRAGRLSANLSCLVLQERESSWGQVNTKEVQQFGLCCFGLGACCVQDLGYRTQKAFF